jgi:hypothetical protein
MIVIGKHKNIVFIGITAFFCSILILKTRSKMIKSAQKTDCFNLLVSFYRFC